MGSSEIIPGALEIDHDERVADYDEQGDDNDEPGQLI